MATNVPGITIGPNGVIIPPDSAIVAGATADINQAFNGNLNPSSTTPQGQLAITLSAIISDKNTQLLTQTNLCDPAFSSGRMQDGIGRIYFIDRIPAQSTVVTCQVSGEVNTPIPAGTYAVDTSNNLYVSLTAATIDATGTINIDFAAVVVGPNPCPAGTLTTPYKTITGWDRITNASDGVLGRLVETAAEFELRRYQSVSINASGILPAIKAKVMATANVTDCYVFENDEGTPLVVGDYTLIPNSIYIAAVGGNDNDVAQAIWSKKGGGCSYNGNTSITVYDSSSYYQQPYPSYTVLFERPNNIAIYFAVTMGQNSGIPDDADTQIQNVILAAFAGADGGTRATIGSVIFASRYYAGIALLGTWAEIVNIKIGSNINSLGDTVSVNIDQMPVTSSDNIIVTVGTTVTNVLSIGTGVFE